MSAGTYVHSNKLTMEQACQAWLASKHSLKPSTLRGHCVSLQPVRDELGSVEVQKLTKAHLDALVGRLRRGEVAGRRKWSARSCNYMLSLVAAILDDQLRQGNVVRNVAALVDRVAGDPKKFRTLTDKEMFAILDPDCRDRHLWTLALYGLRRGEISGLRWEHVDLSARTISIVENRVILGKQHVESGTPKSKASRRTLPVPAEVVAVLTVARQRQVEQRLAFGEGYGGGDYVCSDEMGNPLHPDAITSRWQKVLRDLRIEYVRFARCAALLRHPRALAGHADCIDRGLVRACECGVHDGHLRAFAGRSPEGSRGDC